MAAGHDDVHVDVGGGHGDGEEEQAPGGEGLEPPKLGGAAHLRTGGAEDESGPAQHLGDAGPEYVEVRSPREVP